MVNFNSGTKPMREAFSDEASSSHSSINIKIDSRKEAQESVLKDITHSSEDLDDSPIEIIIMSREGKYIKQLQLLSFKERLNLFEKLNEHIKGDMQSIKENKKRLKDITKQVQDDTERVRKSIEPVTQIGALEQNIEEKVRQFIADNKLKPIDVMSLSLESVLFFKFVHPKFAEDNYELLKSVLREDKSFKENLAKCRKLDKFPPEFMFLLAQDEDKDIKTELSKNLALTSEVIDILLEDESFEIEVNLAKHKNLEDKHITLLLERDLNRINNLKDNIQDAGMVMINLAENKSIKLSDEQKKMFGQAKYDEKFEENSGALSKLHFIKNKLCPPQSILGQLYKMLKSE